MLFSLILDMFPKKKKKKDILKKYRIKVDDEIHTKIFIYHRIHSDNR